MIISDKHIAVVRRVLAHAGDPISEGEALDLIRRSITLAKAKRSLEAPQAGAIETEGRTAA